MMDRAIVMPDILRADRQSTAPNESEASHTEPVKSAVETVPAPRSAI